MSLKQQSFGDMFDRPISERKMPASLERQSFNDDFTHPFSVVWLVSLFQLLMFGIFVNQPISGVIWQITLQSI